jgi:hypothetical protein
MNRTPLEMAKIMTIRAHLAHHLGNKSRAAKSLGCSLRALKNWILQYDELKEFIPPKVKQ